MDPIVSEFEEFVQSTGGTVDDLLTLSPEEVTSMLQQGGFNFVQKGRIRKYLDLGSAPPVVSEAEKKQSR
jgi:uncharacterized protein (DUF2237 family)